MILKNIYCRCKTIRKKRTMEKKVSLASRKKNNKNIDHNLLRRHDQKSTVSDLVYRYLKNIAYTDSIRKQRNNACNRFRRKNSRRRNIHPLHKYINTDCNSIRSYLSKALCFAIHSGFLIPTDRTGRFLQLSPYFTLNHAFDKKYK